MWSQSRSFTPRWLSLHQCQTQCTALSLGQRHLPPAEAHLPPGAQPQFKSRKRGPRSVVGWCRTVSILTQCKFSAFKWFFQLFFQFGIWYQYFNKSRLTTTDCTMHCITPSHHRAVHKAGRWVWSTGDGHQSTTVDNIWRWSIAIVKLFLAQRLGESSRDNYTYFWEIFEFHIWFVIFSSIRVICSLDQKRWKSCGGTILDPIHWLEVPRTQCLNKPTALKFWYDTGNGQTDGRMDKHTTMDNTMQA